MATRRIDLDPLGGVAGDMFAAAMLDAFPDLETRVREHLADAGIPEDVTVKVEGAKKAGFRGSYFAVQPASDLDPPRTFDAMATFLSNGTLDDDVARVATEIFRHLAEAEAHVHGSTIDRIHFHEVSDWDSLVDVVAAASLIVAMGECRWRVSALPLGGGTVKTAHGAIPVPAPATAELLKGYSFHDDGVGGERVTPTGAAIVRYLCPAPGTDADPSPARLAQIGIGCGTRDLDGRANILRVSVFELGAQGRDDVVERLAFEIDDMTGEELAVALDRLRAVTGVLDVCQVSMIGKKGRPVCGVRVLVAPAHANDALNACLSETSTLGVRQQSVARRVLERETVTADVTPHAVAVKRAARPHGVTSAKADSDALATTATLTARRELAERAARSALEHGDDD